MPPQPALVIQLEATQAFSKHFNTRKIKGVAIIVPNTRKIRGVAISVPSTASNTHSFAVAHARPRYRSNTTDEDSRKQKYKEKTIFIKEDFTNFFPPFPPSFSFFSLSFPPSLSFSFLFFFLFFIHPTLKKKSRERRVSLSVGCVSIRLVLNGPSTPVLNGPSHFSFI